MVKQGCYRGVRGMLLGCQKVYPSIIWDQKVRETTNKYKLMVYFSKEKVAWCLFLPYLPYTCIFISSNLPPILQLTYKYDLKTLTPACDVCDEYDIWDWGALQGCYTGITGGVTVVQKKNIVGWVKSLTNFTMFFLQISDYLKCLSFHWISPTGQIQS